MSSTTGKAPTLADIRTWPATVDVPTAGKAFGLSRSHAYELAGRDEFPAKVIRAGNRYRVVTASVLSALSGAEGAEAAA
ncbi:MAG TPA: DNA-binding protein [Streptomyces sp.]|uniref:DNA-binding protein n=1 Tax=Streptomyces sp. TaxID=1931 RepID=UPI002BEBDA0F|nr:DNA-binding protein [Streptomyces sp.]HWU12118.1 DNA-binding protein [Streptomyces sp.]